MSSSPIEHTIDQNVIPVANHRERLGHDHDRRQTRSNSSSPPPTPPPPPPPSSQTHIRPGTEVERRLLDEGRGWTHDNPLSPGQESDNAAADEDDSVIEVESQNVVHVNHFDPSQYHASKLNKGPPPSAPSPLLSANSNLGTTNHHEDNNENGDEQNVRSRRNSHAHAQTQDISEDSAEEYRPYHRPQHNYKRPPGITTATTAMTSTSSAAVAVNTASTGYVDTGLSSSPSVGERTKANANANTDFNDRTVVGSQNNNNDNDNDVNNLPISQRPYIGKITRDNFVRVITMYLEGRLSYPCDSPLPKDPQSVFYSVSAPGISIHFYVHRLVTYTHCSPTVFVVALIFLERIGRLHDKLKLNVMNLHRLLIAAVTVAVKLLDDRVFSNRHYGRVGGVQTPNEMSRMEAAFLRFIEYNIHVSKAEYEELFEGTLQSYHEQLDLARKAQLEQQKLYEQNRNVTVDNNNNKNNRKMEEEEEEENDNDEITKVDDGVTEASSMQHRKGETNANARSSSTAKSIATARSSASTSPAPAHTLPSSARTTVDIDTGDTFTDSNVNSVSSSMRHGGSRAKRWSAIAETQVHSNKRRERDESTSNLPRSDTLEGRVAQGVRRRRLNPTSSSRD